MLMRRSRSLSPCRVLQTTGADSSCSTGRHGLREVVDANRNPLVSTSRVSRKGILSEEASSTNVTPHVQYHHLATRWLTNLQGRRNSWAALASRGRENNYWDGAGGRESRSSRAASAGVLSAAALAFCLKKDSDSKGKPVSPHTHTHTHTHTTLPNPPHPSECNTHTQIRKHTHHKYYLT